MKKFCMTKFEYMCRSSKIIGTINNVTIAANLFTKNPCNCVGCEILLDLFKQCEV